MRMIKRYPIPLSGTYTIEMPNTNRVLSVGISAEYASGRGGVAYVWALVDPNAKTMTRTFRTVSTDEAIEDNMPGYWQFIGTMCTPGTELSFHVFERSPDR
jgi:hypothetical protein